MDKLLFNIQVGVEAILTNKSRALLTSLGIIFGVAAVIAMLSIGAGAEREILKQMKEAGSNNIIIKPKTVVKDANSDQKLKNKYSPGLTLADAENIKKTIGEIQRMSPEIELELPFVRDGMKGSSKLVGISQDYIEIAGLELQEGNRFSEAQITNAEAVCLIGSAVKSKYFAKTTPVGEYIKCGKEWLKVVGVLEQKNVSEKSQTNLSVRNDNNNVYIPINAFLLRYKDRSRVTKKMLEEAFEEDEEELAKKKEENYNQLDRLVVELKSGEYITKATEVVEQILLRRHNSVQDFEIIVPELLLKQEQRTKRLFNLVLGIIASISLLVGGIGIMNIMLASVLERIKEIGLRQAIGATRIDILQQFVSEAMMISITGGIIGVVLGLVLSFVIQKFADIQTIVTPLSIILSFGVSIAVGLVFGIYPAKKASEKNPVESLRYE